MKKILFLFFFLPQLVFAQNGFYTELKPDSTEHINWLLDLQVQGDTIIFYGGHQYGTPIYAGLFFGKMDSLGNLLNYSVQSDSAVMLLSSSVGKLVCTQEGGYLVQGSTFRFNEDSTATLEQNYLLKLDHDLNREFLQFYSFPTYASTINQSLLEDANGYFLFGGHQLPLVNDTNWFVLRTDKEGNELWRKSYFNPHSREYGKEMVQLDENTILLFGFITQDNIDANEDTFSCILL